jgi:hypothetical protein
MPMASLPLVAGAFLLTAASPLAGLLLLQGPGTYENPLGGPVDPMAEALCAHHGRDVVPGTVTLAWQGPAVLGYAFRADAGPCAVERTCILDADPGPEMEAECFTFLAWGTARVRPQDDGAYHLRAYHTTVIMSLEVVDATLRPVA